MESTAIHIMAELLNDPVCICGNLKSAISKKGKRLTHFFQIFPNEQRASKAQLVETTSWVSREAISVK